MSELSLKSITKHYKDKCALNSFSYTFKNGVYGLLGPNGAGKSTLMNIISDNIKPDKGGEILWNGTETAKLKADYRAILGFMPQQQALYDSFTANRFLSYISALKGLKKDIASAETERVLAAVELTEYRDKPIGGYSGGMKQRLLIASTLLGKPQLILLDEPTAGLDPKQRVIIRRLTESLKEQAVVIVSTHIVSDIETIADKVMLLKGGEISADGTVSELSHRLCGEENCGLESVYMKVFGERNENNQQ